MKLRGPWDQDRIEAFLDETAIPLRLAPRTLDGWPFIVSLWFLRRDDGLWCATSRDSYLATTLRRDSRCGFEVAADAPPYRGVRGCAHASIVPDRGVEILRQLMSRYLERPKGKFGLWLLERSDREVAIRLDPQSLTSWDFTARMGREA